MKIGLSNLQMGLYFFIPKQRKTAL